MKCRSGCGACCIAPSVSSSVPGMPQGKAANIPCIQLDERLRCRLFASPQRPEVCIRLQPSREMCGENRTQALRWLLWLEKETMP